MFRKRLCLFVCAATCCLDLAVTTHGQDDGRFNVFEPPMKSSLRTIRTDSELLMFTYLTVDRKLVLAVFEQLRENNLPLRKMSVYKASGQLFEKTQEYVTVDGFVNAYPTVDRTRLITTWVTGSAYRLKVFSLNGPEFKLLVSLGWKQEPEFVDLTGDNEVEILVPVIPIPGRGPESAEIYSWDGRRYVHLRTVSWKQRLVLSDREVAE